ncbi:CapA family protein [Nocardioides sp. GCM10028917]|uniref:CapA family protein n=1 Tax=Nocardioides sp. GCM10028917 TaxID=3273408 RepID=UPI0036210233
MTGDVSRGVRRCGAVLALVLACAAAGCSPTAEPSSPGSARAPAGSTTETPTPTPTPATTPTTTVSAPREPRPGPVEIAVAGDVHFEGTLAARLLRPAAALTPATPALAAADVAIVNLETSVGSGGRPEPGKRFVFSAGAAAFEALAAAGIDVASMANNHALDLGRARLPSTLRAAAAARPELSVVGLGADEDGAFAPAVTDVDGTRVATIAASAADQDPTADPTGAWAAGPNTPGVADANDPRRLLREVRRADVEADVVVTYLHWGVQGERCPSSDQRSLARRLVGAGADVVVGSHAHELQGDGRLGPGYVAYGLGNFAWYAPGPAGVLTLTVQPPREPAGRARVTASRWWPATIGADGLASPDSGAAAAASRDRRTALRECAGLR